MSRRLLIILVSVGVVIIILGIVLSRPQTAPISLLPTPTQSVFSPSFLPSPPPSISPTIPTQALSISIMSVPQGAKISVDNQVIGNAPLKYTFQTQKQYHITALKDGFVPLALDFVPTAEAPSLRLPLVALNTLPTAGTFVPVTSSTPSPTIPQAKPVDFPQAYSLNNNTLPREEFIYTQAPRPTTSSDTQGQDTTSPVPVTSASVSAIPTNSTATNPSEQEIARYQNIINRFTGVYASDPNDTVEQGTAGEHVIVIDDQHFYPSPLDVFVAFKPHFVNITTSTCTLQAMTDQHTTLRIGTLAPNQDRLFTPSPDLNGTWQFWCQERPTIISSIQFFS